jgi:hypothetical protein
MQDIHRFRNLLNNATTKYGLNKKGHPSNMDDLSKKDVVVFCLKLGVAG